MKMTFNFILVFLLKYQRVTLTIATTGRLTAIILMLSLMGFSAASLLSLHIHVLPNGRVVAHSHPHSDDDSEHQHHHTAQEFVVLQVAGRTLETGGIISVGELTIEFQPRGAITCYVDLSAFAAPVPLVTGRAPPLSPMS
jgi:hypothetical protein